MKLLLLVPLLCSPAFGQSVTTTDPGLLGREGDIAGRCFHRILAGCNEGNIS
jgi:hypothetical protein